MMKFLRYIRRVALFITNFCILGIIYDNIIKNLTDPDYEIIWWIAMIFFIIWYGCECWEEM